MTTRSIVDPYNSHKNGHHEHRFGLENTHLERFHKAPPAPALSGYGVFHGDARCPEGEPLPTGSLRRSLRSTGASAYSPLSGGPPAAYTIRPTMSLRTLTKDRPEWNGSTTLGSTSSFAPNATPTAFKYANSTTFISTSSLPPTQYKAWTSEYGSEYKGPKARKEMLEQLTIRHGTKDALRTSRYQFQGYPHYAINPAMKTLVPSSLTQRGTPTFKSSLNAF